MYPFVLGLFVGNSIIFAIHSIRVNERYKKDIDLLVEDRNNV